MFAEAAQGTVKAKLLPVKLEGRQVAMCWNIDLIHLYTLGLCRYEYVYIYIYIYTYTYIRIYIHMRDNGKNMETTKLTQAMSGKNQGASGSVSGCPYRAGRVQHFEAVKYHFDCVGYVGWTWPSQSPAWLETNCLA